MSKKISLEFVSKNNEALNIYNLSKEKPQNSILYVAKNDREIFDLKENLNWLLPNYEILIFRSWDNIPYDNVSPSNDIQSERITTLYNLYLNNLKKKIVLTSVNAIIQKTLSKNFLKDYYLKVSKNTKTNFELLISKLINLGYQRTNIVRDKSEFAVRGSIIDIFPSNRNFPIRLDFFDQNLDNIKEFDRVSQISLKIIDHKITIYPSTELLINKNTINNFRQSFRSIFHDYRNSNIYNSFSENIIPPGGENYLPIFYNSLDSIFSYSKNFNIILNSDFDNLIDQRLENIYDFYNSRLDIDDKYHLHPKYFFFNKSEIENFFKSFELFKLTDYEDYQTSKFKIKFLQNLSTIKKEINFDLIEKFISINRNKKIIICARSPGSLIRIKEIFLENLNIHLNHQNNISKIEKGLNISVFKIDVSIQFNEFIFINEKFLFGYFLSTQSKSTTKKEIFFEEINKLTKNSILVHSEYGLCKFLDIKKIDVNFSLHDCIELEFSENQKLFLPIENLNMVTKYANDDNNSIKLDKLGALSWQKRKANTKNRIKDIANKLISIAAKRLNSKSYKIEFNPVEYEKFASTFPFVETNDQLKAINDVKNDFLKEIPADRLIVGDVAFGKTEVIIRSVFLAAKSKLQSVILVPTTLLSRQHLINFNKRLKNFNIKVEEISRLISNKDKLKIFKLLEDGKIDVIIGTHSLFNDKIKFKKLGLIIYDEEQKLGTRQKEKFKFIAPNAHVISLSATPIPRTLSLSLSGIRDLSIISTAPFERLSVRTFISPFDNITVLEAIKREIFGRKNSVFLVVPRKKDIPFLENFISNNLPQIKFVTAHGKLKPELLEERITKFYNKIVPLLISTNIIENGLDLPHVNTIIIYRSNIFPLASLYQLKGRVGRSTKRGYAYLTYNEKELTENARKRLKIINSYQDIGSGFNIASQDLDMRGGGSLIGEEQSGFIKEVGIELYHQMLEEEINKQKIKIVDEKNQDQKFNFQPLIKIPEPIFIPNEFIHDSDIKMTIYKRISMISNEKEKNNLMVELVDRFGKLPKEVKNLFKLIEIKILCLKLHIELVEYGKKGILFSFYKNKPLNPDKILNLSLMDKNISIRSDQKLFYNFLGNSSFDRFNLIKQIFKKLN